MIRTARRSRWPRRWCSAMAALGVLVVAAACGGTTVSAGGGNSGPSTTAGSALPAPPPVEPVTWTACPHSQTLECGTVSVPVDYRQPNGAGPDAGGHHGPRPSIRPTLTGRCCSNPGGPGQSGNQILPVVLTLFPSSVRQDFDIVSFDPRGTGDSDPLRCGTAPSVMTSLLPVPAAGHPTTGYPRSSQPWPGPAPRVAGAVEPFITTTNTARDMDRIRQALGLSTVSYYGLSYGTVLGAVYADLFPHRVRAMVLDGAVDANATLTQQADEQAPAAERSVRASTGRLRSDAGVSPGERSRGVLPVPGRLAGRALRCPPRATATPSRSPWAISTPPPCSPSACPGSPPSTTRRWWPPPPATGAPLRSLALELATDVDGDPLVDPLWAITCNDAAAHPLPPWAPAARPGPCRPATR